MTAGRFITFEGIDGAGKSSQAQHLADTLRAAGRDVVLTREPGGSPGAEDIRHLLVDGPPDRWSAETEILLFTAARRDHLERTISPALAAGRTVICDRFADSTRVYQGATRGDLRAIVDALHAQMIGIEPALTLILDLAPDRAAARMRQRAGAAARFEAFGTGFQDRLRAGFRALAEAFPARCVIVDADRDAALIAADIARIAARRLAVVAPAPAP
ncbi:MAG TPA: dTMP kinase [Rhodobacteraceae bacterium]|jgi:dTMP kinase|nr:dTMP kinase [Paracoccaceae bacterium]HBG98381.1 dTMP kinase [Paracoccaceae bacterium]